MGGGTRIWGPKKFMRGGGTFLNVESPTGLACPPPIFVAPPPYARTTDISTSVYFFVTNFIALNGNKLS